MLVRWNLNGCLSNMNDYRFSAPRGPPRPPRPMPSPTTEWAFEMTACTKTPVSKSTPTDMAIPTNPESVTLHFPTNMKFCQI